MYDLCLFKKEIKHFLKSIPKRPVLAYSSDHELASLKQQNIYQCRLSLCYNKGFHKVKILKS
jgi:hypothetical protein